MQRERYERARWVESSVGYVKQKDISTNNNTLRVGVPDVRRFWVEVKIE